MNRQSIMCIAATLAIACALPAAQAAGPQLKERQAKLDRIKLNHLSVKQPRTMAEAEKTKVQMDNGGVSIQVPIELWNMLSVQKDANGNLRVHESDGTSAAATTTKGLDNE